MMRSVLPRGKVPETAQVGQTRITGQMALAIAAQFIEKVRQGLPLGDQHALAPGRRGAVSWAWRRITP